jgi:hypothetical protein
VAGELASANAVAPLADGNAEPAANIVASFPKFLRLTRIGKRPLPEIPRFTLQVHGASAIDLLEHIRL